MRRRHKGIGWFCPFKSCLSLELAGIRSSITPCPRNSEGVRFAHFPQYGYYEAMETIVEKAKQALDSASPKEAEIMATVVLAIAKSEEFERMGRTAEKARKCVKSTGLDESSFLADKSNYRS